ncbi:MAG: 4Fe-4S binding protein [Deltaproteobacteria bacterium]|nr:4Fe-4S binding protein [Deltaproteobacteria bacterium]
MKPLKAAIKRRARRQRWLWWILPFMMIAGWRYPVLGYFIPFCMVAGLGIAIFRGRSWCDWLCPRGSFWDVVLSRVSMKKKIPAILRNSVFRIMVLVFLLVVLATQLPRFWPNINGMGLVFVTMLTATTVVGIILGIVFHPRSWCAICPIGTMGNWLGRGKYPLMVDAKCDECAVCDKVCPIQINRWQYRPEESEAVVIPEWDCLKCGLCVAACPQEALTLKKGE